MSKINTVTFNCATRPDHIAPKSIKEIAELIGVKYDYLGLNAASLPFAPSDTTAGSESEMQTVVVGSRDNVDLPLFIEQSNYFANTKRRAKSGDTSRKVMTDLEKYLNTNTEGVWENSQVRFLRYKMGKLAENIFQQDILADKKESVCGP